MGPIADTAMAQHRTDETIKESLLTCFESDRLIVGHMLTFGACTSWNGIRIPPGDASKLPEIFYLTIRICCRFGTWKRTLRSIARTFSKLGKWKRSSDRLDLLNPQENFWNKI